MPYGNDRVTRLGWIDSGHLRLGPCEVGTNGARATAVASRL